MRANVIQYVIDDRECPSGLPHKVVGKVVKNVLGNSYCLHPACTAANMDEILKAHDDNPQWTRRYG